VSRPFLSRFLTNWDKSAPVKKRDKVAIFRTMAKQPALPAKRPAGTWIQTGREAHEAWALLSRKPAASAVMHILCAHLGEHNAVVISQETIARLCKLSTRSVRRGILDLIEGNWIEVRQIGATGTTNAYVVNDRVAWQGSRDGLRYSLFSAAVFISEEEQPDRDDLERQAPLRRLPRIGEQQLPAGEGLPPPSQPFLAGLEPDLPAAGRDENR
jgi:hypothetical protein